MIRGGGGINGSDDESCNNYISFYLLLMMCNFEMPVTEDDGIDGIVIQCQQRHACKCKECTLSNPLKTLMKHYFY